MKVLQKFNEKYTWKPALEKGKVVDFKFSIAPLFRLNT